jgi:Tape measure protein
MVIRELFAKLGFTIDDASLIKFDKSMARAGREAVRVAKEAERAAQKAARETARAAEKSAKDATRSANAAAKAAERAAQKVARENARIAKEVARLAEKAAAKAKAAAEKAANEAEKAAKKIRASLGDAGLNAFRGAVDRVNSAINTTAKVAVGGMVIGLGALAFGAAKTTAEFESLKASLKTVTGSAEAADRAFAQLRTFAKDTPFQLQEVVSAYVKLKGAGLDSSNRALTAYGNIAGANSKSLDDVVEAVKDAAVGEFERLKEFNIKASSQGNKVSMTFQGVTTQIGKNAAEIEAYIKRIGAVNFAGGMAEQMKTLGGVISNLKDAFHEFLVGVGSGGLVDALKDVSRELIAMFTGSGDVAKSLGQTLGNAVRKLWSEMKRLGPSMMEIVDSLPRLVSGALELVRIFVDLVRNLGGPGGVVALLISAKAAMIAFSIAGSDAAGSIGGLRSVFGGLGLALVGAGLIITKTRGEIDKLRDASNRLTDDLAASAARIAKDMSRVAIDARKQALSGQIAAIEAEAAAAKAEEGKGPGVLDHAVGNVVAGIPIVGALVGTTDAMGQGVDLALGTPSRSATILARADSLRAEMAALDAELDGRGQTGLEAAQAGAAMAAADAELAAAMRAGQAQEAIDEAARLWKTERLKMLRAKAKKKGLTPNEKKAMTALQKELNIEGKRTGGGSRKKAVDLSKIEEMGVADFLRNRGSEAGLDPLLAGVTAGGGASPEAIQTALEAAARAANKGAAPEVAKKAGLDALRKLTGEGKGSKRGVDDILEDFGAGRTRGGTAVGGVMPTLGTTVNKTYYEFKPTVTNTYALTQTDGESGSTFLGRIKETVNSEMQRVYREQYERFVGPRVA